MYVTSELAKDFGALACVSCSAGRFPPPSQCSHGAGSFFHGCTDTEPSGWTHGAPPGQLILAEDEWEQLSKWLKEQGSKGLRLVGKGGRDVLSRALQNPAPSTAAC